MIEWQEEWAKDDICSIGEVIFIINDLCVK